MPNLRIVDDNAIERATLAASSNAGASFMPANLANDLKANLWRGLSKVERLDASWTVAELIQAVGAPNCNLSPTALWRIRASNEAAATNLLRYSAAFDNALWVNNGTTYAANVVAAPDGTMTGDRLLETATTADHMMTAPSVTVTAGVTYTWSIFVKADTRKRIRLMFPAAQFAANERATFDVTSNTIPSSTGNGAPTITPGPDGWDRITLTGVCTTGGSAVLTLYMMPDTGTTTTSYAGAITSTIYIWGAQLETGAVATSYYPTTSAAATRPAGHVDSWQSYDYDSGWVLACPAPAAKVRRMTAAQAASAYGFGGGAFARHWLPTAVQARRLVVDINDANNLQGFVEMANLVAAPYFEAEKNADYGAEATPVDSTVTTRSGAGDLMAAQSTRSKKLAFSLSKMSPTDRARVWDMLRASGVGYPVWISLFPEDADLALEATHQIWGNLEQLPAMALPSFKIASARISVQSS